MDSDLVFGDNAPAAKPKKAAKKTSTKKPVVDVVAAEEPKSQKRGWPIVWIDAVDGMPNYEVVGVNGKVYQIRREEEVPVPPEVIEVLKNAVGIKLVDVHNPMGGITRKEQKYSTIPWRIVGYES